MKKLHYLSMLSMALVLASATFLTNCTGKDGAVGPQGATGAAGPTGATGAVGSANVSYSDWLDLIPNKLPSRESTIIAPKITQNVMDNSDVRVYIKIGSLVSSLPYSDLSYWLLLGKIVIQVAGNSTMNTGIKVRYIIIYGGTSIASGRRTAIDYSNYEALKAAYNLPD